MSRAQYTLIETAEQSLVTVLVPGHGLKSTTDANPNFPQIVYLLTSDESVDPEEFVTLFDAEAAVKARFTNLSERVAVSNGHVFFDGDEIDSSITQQIIRFLDEDVTDWVPLVRFMENVATNPNEHSRIQLYDWLRNHAFTLTREGNIIGYKGVVSNDDGSFSSLSSGRATVNGAEQSGQIRQEIGDVVEMPRSAVAHDPAAACSTGLHVGTYEYASGFNRGALLEVHVNPRDVVSVPTDASGAKVRVCRYIVVGTLDAPYYTAYAEPDEYECDEPEPDDLYTDPAESPDYDERYSDEFQPDDTPAYEPPRTGADLSGSDYGDAPSRPLSWLERIGWLRRP